LLSVSVYGLTVSVTEMNNTNTSTKSTTSYGFIGIIIAGFMALLLSIYILYHYKTRKVLYISGIADEIDISDIQSVLPGATSIIKNNDDQLIVFDTNTNATISFNKCTNKNNSIVFRNSKIKLKWKSIFGGSNGIKEVVKKKRKNKNIPDGYTEFHGFLIPSTSSIETYEHTLQYNTHTLGEGKITVIQKINPKSQTREV